MDLTTLGTPYPFKRSCVWRSGKYRFTDKDIGNNFDEVEEQLWAMRQGLA